MGGLFILVDLLSGCGVGVGGVGIGFVIGVRSGEVWAGWAGFVAGVGVVLISVSVLVGDVVSFLGVWGDVGGGSVGDLGDVVVSSEGEVGGR